MMSRHPKDSSVTDRLDADVEHALRIVLVVALSRDDAARLVDRPCIEGPVTLRPSSLYGWLTRQMLTSQRSWRHGAAHLDQRLSPWLERFHDRSAMDLAQAFAEGRDAWSAPELAALLWALIRREEPAWRRVLHRLTGEIEIAVLQMTMRRCLNVPATQRTARPKSFGHHRRQRLATVVCT
jgi:hypothetical protein